MINLDKYRIYDYLTLQGIDAIVEQENTEGELVNHVMCKSASWIKRNFVLPAGFNEYARWCVDELNQQLCTNLTVADIMPCDDYLEFTIQENADGYPDENGNYFTTYVVQLKINGVPVDESDLQEMFSMNQNGGITQ